MALGRFENTDFEQGDLFWNESAPVGGTLSVQTNAVNARSGSKYMYASLPAGSGSCEADAAARNGVIITMPVVPGQCIQYGGWMYRESGTAPAWIVVNLFDASMVSMGNTSVGQDGTIGSWKYYHLTYTIPSGVYNLQFHVQMNQDTGAAAMRWDDVYCSVALDVQHIDQNTNAYTCQTGYLQYQSMTLKFNTFDFQLIDPVVIPALGDTVTATDPNIALSWSGTVARVNLSSVSEKGGHKYVTVSATNQNVATASVAPFDLSDNSQPLRNWIADPGFEDANLAATQNSWDLAAPAEFSLDAVNFHGGAKSLLCTTTRTASGWNAAQPHMPGGTSEVGVIGTQDAFAVAPGQTYTLTAWAKALAGSKQNHMKILWYKDLAGTASAIRAADYPMAGTDGPYGWVQVGGTVTAPQDARYAVIELMFGYWDGVTGANGQSWFDDVTFGGSAKFREASHGYSRDQSGSSLVSSSYLTQQTGLWPIQTVAITNADLGLVNADYSVSEVSLSWDIDHITPWQKITVGDPVVTLSVWMNSANAGILPITTTKITDGAVTTPKVAANAITAAQIAAGAITADKLTATLVLASLIKAGAGVAHVEMDQNGLRAYDGSGNLVVNIPTDGVSPVTINANVLAKSLIVSGNSVFQGAKNEVALGAVLQLDSSLQNPAQAPSIAQTWGGSALPINSTYDNNGSTTYTRVGLAYDAAGGAGGTTAVFWQATQNNGAKHDYLLELLAAGLTVNRTRDLTADGFQTPLDVCRLGSYVYVLGIDGGTGAPSSWGQTGAATSSFNYTGSGSDNQISTAAAYTAPGSGTITSMSIRCAGHTASCGFYFCIWDTGGNLVANSAYTSLSSTLQTNTLGISKTVTSGQQFYFGFWADRTGQKQWGVASSGSFDWQTNLSGISSLSGRAACTSPYVCGQMQAYVTYTPDTRVWKVRRYVESTLALDTTYASIAYLSAPTTPKMCADGTNLFIVDRASGANVKWQKYDGSLATVGALVDSGYNPGASVNAVAAGNADIGAWRMFVLTGSTVDDFDATPTRQSANEGFSTPAAAYGLTYDGTRFWSLPGTGGGQVSLTQHSTWIWTTASSVYWVAYTWYDGQASHIHETQVSPYASITMSRRAQLTITTPSIPGTAGLDDPDHVRIYALPNATVPGSGAAKLQSSQTTTTLVMTSYASGGAADPGSNNFPTGSSGQIQSEIGNTFIKGDGTVQFGQGVPVAPGNGVAPVGGWGSVPVKIAEIVTTAGQLTVDFTSIPQGFKHLYLYYAARDQGAGTNIAWMPMTLNGDTAGHYYGQDFYAQITTTGAAQVGAATSMNIATIVNGGAAAGLSAVGLIQFPFYNSTSWSRSVLAQIQDAWGAALNGTRVPVGFWNVASAITRITFTPSSAFAAGSIFSLYGVP